MTVTGQINAAALLEFRDTPVDHTLIEIISTEAIVARGCLDLDLRLAIDLINLQNGDVECSTTQVEDENGLIIFLVDTVGQSGRCRLVDDSQNLKSGDSTRILGGLALCIGEVCRTGDDRLLDLLAKVSLSICLQLL